MSWDRARRAFPRVALLTEFVRLCIVGLRDWTGGSLGTQPKRYGDGLSLYAVQFETDRVIADYLVLAMWVIGLLIWVEVDRSMDRYALDAVTRDEDAEASVGINVTREKLKIPALSAGVCAFGGAIFTLGQAIYGLLLIYFIIYMPRGIIGSLMDRLKRRNDE